MTVASSTTSRWAVSTRTHGEVLTAGASTPELELVLLGVPDGFTPPEIEGWMHDLAGVAIETSRSDTRVRAIPALLHHGLTGLLFSQAELWSRPGQHGPCSAAFVESPAGPAFGWVGEARVHVLLDGTPYEPQWVRVRDDGEREGRAAVFPSNVQVLLTVDYWPQGGDGADGTIAPVAIEAEWTPHAEPAAAATLPAPEPVATPEPPAESRAALAPALPDALPESLPTQQPGLAAPIVDAIPPESAGGPPDARAAHEVHEAAEAAPSAEAAEPATGAIAPVPDADAESRPVHPIGRWLGRMLGWGRREARARVPETDSIASEATPLSSYDALLSEDVPRTPLVPDAEQTAMPFVAPPRESAFDPAALDAAESFEPIPEVTDEEFESRMPDDRAAAIEDVFEANEAFEPPLDAGPALVLTPPVGGDATRPTFADEVAAIDATTLPVLSPIVDPVESGPLTVDHEPVGAAESFAIPPVPAAPPSAAVAPAPVAPPPVPAAPPVLRVAAPPSGPPVLRVQVVPPRPDAPPVLRVTTDLPPAEAPADAELPGAATAEPLEIEGSEAAPLAPRRRWPAPEPPRARTPEWLRRPWLWGSAVLLVFALGWWVGGQSNPDHQAPSALTRVLRAVGLAGARYEVAVNSTPNGAWIAVDGKDLALRTPANVELTPGAHVVTLTLPDLGSAKFPVQGRKGDRVTLDESLNGGLQVVSSDPDVPITVALDGKPQGYAPVDLESLAPGLHEVQFTGPGMPAWAQTVQVGVRTTAQLVAHPMSAPANGVIQVQATLNDERGSSPLSGAQVYVDGELRGVTPLSLDLVRGPHSLRLSWHGETPPVQVIDLPGGNQRIASFAFGLEGDSPSIVLAPGSHAVAPGRDNVVAATLRGLAPNEVREAWLRVRTPEGLWSRYAMAVARGNGGASVTSVFPANAFDAQGQSRWFVSATTLQGDEYFSEMQGGGGARAAAPKRESPARK